MTKSNIRRVMVVSVWAAAAVLVVTGCEMSGRRPDVGAASAPAAAAPVAAKAEKSGTELWSDTCGHCHNLRSPSGFSPAQWEVAVYDMRVRAHLTGEEQRKILEFLKAASQ